jgi:hypothetical protein
MKSLAGGVDQNGEQATYLKHTFVADQTSVASKTKGWNNAVWLAVGKYNKTERIYSGACNGDSGGPLYSLVGSSKTLIGLTSWGAADCELGKPSVYTLPLGPGNIRARGFEPAACSSRASFERCLSQP